MCTRSAMVAIATMTLVVVAGCTSQTGYPQSVGVGGDISATRVDEDRIQVRADLAAWIDDADGCLDPDTCEARIHVDVVVDGTRRVESFVWDIGTDAPRARIARSVESTIRLEPGRHCVLVSLAQDGRQVIEHRRQGTSALLTADVMVEGGSTPDHCRYRTHEPADTLPHVAPVVECQPVLADVPDGTHVQRRLEVGEPIYASVGGCQGTVQGAVLVRDGRMVINEGRDDLHVGRVVPLDVRAPGQWLQILVFGAEDEGVTGPPSSNPVLVETP